MSRDLKKTTQIRSAGAILYLDNIYYVKSRSDMALDQRHGQRRHRDDRDPDKR